MFSSFLWGLCHYTFNLGLWGFPWCLCLEGTSILSSRAEVLLSIINTRLLWRDPPNLSSSPPPQPLNPIPCCSPPTFLPFSTQLAATSPKKGWWKTWFKTCWTRPVWTSILETLSGCSTALSNRNDLRTMAVVTYIILSVLVAMFVKVKRNRWA